MLGKNLDAYEKTTPQHVKAARQLADVEGREIGSGEIIHYVKTQQREKLKSGGYKYIDDVEPIQLATDGDINVKKYIEQLQSTFAPITESLSIEWQRDIEGLQALESFGIGV